MLGGRGGIEKGANHMQGQILIVRADFIVSSIQEMFFLNWLLQVFD